MYTNVKNEAHQKDPQLKMPCKKIQFMFICLFVIDMKQDDNAHHKQE